MHALHHWDGRPLVVALLALLLTIATALAAVSLPDIDLGSGGASASPPPTVTSPAGTPAWASDPLAPPSLLAE